MSRHMAAVELQRFARGGAQRRHNRVVGTLRRVNHTALASVRMLIGEDAQQPPPQTRDSTTAPQKRKEAGKGGAGLEWEDFTGARARARALCPPTMPPMITGAYARDTGRPAEDTPAGQASSRHGTALHRAAASRSVRSLARG